MIKYAEIKNARKRKSDKGIEYRTPLSPNFIGSKSANPTPNIISLTIDNIVDSSALPIACKKIKHALLTQANIIIQRYILNDFTANSV